MISFSRSLHKLACLPDLQLAPLHSDIHSREAPTNNFDTHAHATLPRITKTMADTKESADKPLFTVRISPALQSPHAAMCSIKSFASRFALSRSC